MWIKFSILMFVALINIILGFLIIFKNKNNDKSKLYFSLMCFSAGLWSLVSALIQIISNVPYYIWVDRFIYVFTSFSVLSFLFFSYEFPYRIKRILSLLKYFFIIITFLMILLVLSNKFILGVYYYNGSLYQLENKGLNLIYGLYFIILLTYSYYLLFYKYFKSQGINKSVLKYLIHSTLIPFILSVLFAWYLPYIGKHYLYWIGPVFTIIMNYLIFRLFLGKTKLNE
jgi:N-terminal 7TM region of histidine kinase